MCKSSFGWRYLVCHSDREVWRENCPSSIAYSDIVSTWSILITVSMRMCIWYTKTVFIWLSCRESSYKMPMTIIQYSCLSRFELEGDFLIVTCERNLCRESFWSSECCLGFENGIKYLLCSRNRCICTIKVFYTYLIIIFSCWIEMR